jgi:hypothetical protein
MGTLQLALRPNLITSPHGSVSLSTAPSRTVSVARSQIFIFEGVSGTIRQAHAPELVLVVESKAHIFKNEPCDFKNEMRTGRQRVLEFVFVLVTTYEGVVISVPTFNVTN